MIRRNLIKAALAIVAGLLGAKGKANHFPDSRKKETRRIANIACSSPEPVFDEKRLITLIDEWRKPPAPAPGQVWETPKGKTVILCRSYYHNLPVRIVDVDTGTNWLDLTIGGEGWRYLGHIRDLAAIARCTAYDRYITESYDLAGGQQ